VIEVVSVIAVARAIAEELVIGPASVPAAAVEVPVVIAWVIEASAVAHLVEVVLEVGPEGLAEQAHVLVAVEALPAWEVSAVVVAAAAVVLVAVVAAVVVAAVVVAEAEGGKS
jgi:hypothetical protein